MYLEAMFFHLGDIFTFTGVAVLFSSVAMGICFGALPGLTATLAVALLSTLTFTVPTEYAIVSLIGAYVGAIYGPSHSAILLGIPGTAAGAATALDGYPLAMQGRAGETIVTATIASAIGTLIGLLAMILLLPPLLDLALQFTSAEFFLLAVFGVLICGSLTAPDLAVKGWIAGILGLLISLVGMDTLHGYNRFTFGIPELSGGIEVVPVILGAFALPQIIRALRNPADNMGGLAPVSKLNFNWSQIYRNKIAIPRSGLIGVITGTIPGVGEDIAAWASYDTAKKLSSDGASFGKGNITGVISSETANNSCIGGALIPVLALGIPGSPPAAMLLGALWLHGVQPGPMIAFQNPDFIPQIAATLFWATIVMVICGLLLARVTLRVLRMPLGILMPIVAVLAVTGSYALGLNMFNVYMMLFFGIIVYFLDDAGYPVAPLVIGLILGSMGDESLRRALMVSGGDITPFYSRPVAQILLLLIALSLFSQSKYLKKLFITYSKILFSKKKNGTTNI